MLAAGVHLGTKNLTNGMSQYVYKRRQDGLHLMHLGKTWEKLMLAARIIVAVENPADIVVVSGRPYGQRACYKFGQYTGSNFLSGRFTPGTFTNQINKKFVEPRVIIVTDPRTDYQVCFLASVHVHPHIPLFSFVSLPVVLVFVCLLTSSFCFNFLDNIFFHFDESAREGGLVRQHPGHCVLRH